METVEEPPKRRRKRVHRGKSGGSWAKRLKKAAKKHEGAIKRDTSSEIGAVGNGASKDSTSAKLTEQLISARFRFINEKLYNCTGDEAERFFAEDADAFRTYHAGYAQQVAKWPSNPVKSIFRYLKKNVERSSTIVDMGAGEAILHQRLHDAGFKALHSFDLMAANERVTVANMNKIPMPSNSVDVVVFCLSLMGTNIAEYLKEANRLLRVGGQLIIAEVRSRFRSLKFFMKGLKSLGFSAPERAQPIGGGMFVLLICVKETKPRNRRPQGLSLEPCLYKKR